MKPFRFNPRSSGQRAGFSLVEVSFSIGIFSFGFLTLAPFLALGLKTARLGRDDQATAQIARTLMEEGRQGTLSPGTAYLDIEGNTLPSAQGSAFTAQETFQAVGGNSSLTQLILRVQPIGAPDRERTYAVVYPTPPTTAP
jgi:uncharacterized protein (TIGR02598 family)